MTADIRLERVSRLIRSAIIAHERFILSFAQAQPGTRKQAEFRLRSGAQVCLTFTDVDRLLAMRARSFEPATEPADWMSYKLRVDGQIKVDAQFRPGELELKSYLPGAWEYSLGATNDDDPDLCSLGTIRHG